MVGTDGEVPQLHVLEAGGERVHVEQDLFGGLRAAMPAAQNGIRFALFGAAVIVIFVALEGDGKVGFLNAAEDFVIEALLESLGRWSSKWVSG
jgi:hypothetical protein